MSKIIILGSNGMLGQEFVDYLGKKKNYQIFALAKKEVNIAKMNGLIKIIAKIRPNFIINCAALIDVDYCEKNPFETFKINAIGPGNIIKCLNQLKLWRTIYIHLSTSDIFGNNKDYFKESDLPTPVNVYGWSKLFGEKMVEFSANINNIKYYIIRTSWLYSLHKDTFVDLVIKSLQMKKSITVIDDQYNIPTWTSDLVRAVEGFIVSNNKYESGVYHLLNQSNKRLSKYDIAQEAAKILNLDKRYLKKGFKKDIFEVARPESAVLINTKFAQLPDWKESLTHFLKLKYGE